MKDIFVSRRAVTIIDESFESICKEDQTVFDNDKHLQMLPIEVRSKIPVKPRGDERWDKIMKLIEEVSFPCQTNS